MDTLIVVRYPDCDRDGSLPEPCRNQMLSLASKFRLLADGGTVAILTSPAPAARLSSGILAEELGVEAKECEFLGQRVKPRSVLDLIRLHEAADVVILVADSDHSAEIPSLFGKVELDTMEFPRHYLNGGWARAVDLADGSCRDILGELVPAGQA